MALTSASTYWLTLARTAVRPSWVASQATDRLGDRALAFITVPAWLLPALAVVKARPGVTVRWRVGRQVSDSDSVLRIELVVVMNQPRRAVLDPRDRWRSSRCARRAPVPLQLDDVVTGHRAPEDVLLGDEVVLELDVVLAERLAVEEELQPVDELQRVGVVARCGVFRLL